LRFRSGKVTNHSQRKLQTNPVTDTSSCITPDDSGNFTFFCWHVVGVNAHTGLRLRSGQLQ